MKIKEKEFELIVEEFKNVATEMGVTIRFEKGDFKGGYCLLKSSRVIVINKNANVQRRAMIIASALKELGIEDIYIAPKTRDMLELLVGEVE